MCAVAATDEHEGRQYAAGDLELFNLLTHPVWIFDVEGKCMYWANKAALKLWQADSLETLLARDFEKDLTPATRVKIDDQLQSLRAGHILSEQWTMYPQNVPTTVNMTGSAIRIQGGRVAALMEAEISEKKYEDSTVRGIELLRQLPLPVFQFTIEGTLIYRNPEAIRVYDNGAEKAGTDKTLLGLFVDKNVGSKLFRQVVDGDGADCTVEAEHFTADGRSRWFLVSVRRARDPVAKSTTGNVILLTARDITDVLQARKDSATANLKAEFLAVLAHDIRTPASFVSHPDSEAWPGGLQF
jgi:PAS domain-containing protein